MNNKNITSETEITHNTPQNQVISIYGFKENEFRLIGCLSKENLQEDYFFDLKDTCY